MNRLLFAFLLLQCIPVHANVLYVDQANDTGGNNGTSWEDSFQNLTVALANAVEGDSIWIAAGEYKPTETDDRTVSFSVPEGVKLFGGFTGTESALAERNLSENQTVLSGDIGLSNDFADNSYTVLRIELQNGAGAELNGLIIREGTALTLNCAECAGDTGRCKGGGVYVEVSDNSELSNLAIIDCLFENNEAYAGGGLYVDAIGAVDVILRGSVFRSDGNPGLGFCTLSDSGGGAYISQNNSNTYAQSFLAEDCVFTENYTELDGGGLYYAQKESADTLFAAVEIVSCEFDGNFMPGIDSGSGIGAYIAGNATEQGDVRLRDCNFTGNIGGTNLDAGSGGLALPVGGEGTVVTGSTFQNNVADSGGGILAVGKLRSINNLFRENSANKGAAVSSFFELEIFNTLFVNNSSFADEGGLIDNLSFKKSEISNSVFYGNNTGNAPYLLDLAGADYNVTNCIFWNNSAQHVLDYGTNSTGTVTFRNCIVEQTNCDEITTAISSEAIVCENVLYNTDPDFADEANEDFSLQPCSVGINAGSTIPETFTDIITDFAGNSRIIDDIADIGAYENEGIRLFVTATDASGATAADGFILIDSINGGVPPYTLTINEMPVGNEISNLLPGDYTVSVTDSTGCTESITLNVSFISVATSEELNLFRIFPNPVTDILYFENNALVNENVFIDITTIQGKTVWQAETVLSPEFSIDTAKWSSGIYFVTVKTTGVVQTEKVVK